MASITDKITDTRNAARPITARVTVARVSAGATLQCNSLTGWPTASKVHFVTYQIDTNNETIAGTQLDCYGIVSGADITSMTVVDGTDGGNSVGDVVEMLPTSAWGQDLADAITAQHSRVGAHTSVTNTGGMTTDTLTVTSGTTLPAGDIANADLATNSVSTVKIQDDAVTAAKLDGIDKSLLTTDSNPYKFSAYISATAAFSNGVWTTVDALTENFDTNNNLVAATGIYTVPISGFYQLNAYSSTTNASGNLLGGGIRILKNGTTAVVGGGIRVDNGWSEDVEEFACSNLVQLTAGDTLVLQGYLQLAGGSVGLADANFSGFLVSRT